MDNETISPPDDNDTSTEDMPLHQQKTTYDSWYKLWWIIILLLVSLFIGIAGYYYFAKLSFTDSLLNASMILGGMGPVDTLTNNQSKLFASFYALYSGMIFLVLVAFLIDSII